MKFKILFLLLLSFGAFTNCVAQSSTSFVSLLTTETKEHSAKLVHNNRVNDTIITSVKVKYNTKAPFQFIVSESFTEGKIYFKEDKKLIARKQKEIKFLEFIDNKGQERHFAFIPELKEKNVAEIRAKGKVNYYVVHSNKDIVASSHGRVFIQKDDKWIKHKKWINKDYLKKIQSLISDEPDLAQKLNVEEISQEEIFKILNDYNSRKN